MRPDQLDCFLPDDRGRELGGKSLEFFILGLVDFRPGDELLTPRNVRREFIVAEVRHVTLFEFYGHVGALLMCLQNMVCAE